MRTRLTPSRRRRQRGWSDAILLPTNNLDRSLREPIKFCIDLFLAGEWERVWNDSSEDADAMPEAAREHAPPTPEVGIDLGQGFRVPQYDAPPPHVAAFTEIRRFDRALKLFKLGRMADAVRALMPAKRAPRNDGTLAKVRDFFPASGGDELDLESASVTPRQMRRRGVFSRRVRRNDSRRGPRKSGRPFRVSG